MAIASDVSLVFTEYSSGDIQKTTLSGSIFYTKEVDAFILYGEPRPSEFSIWGTPDLQLSFTTVSMGDESGHQLQVVSGSLYAVSIDGHIYDHNSPFSSDWLAFESISTQKNSQAINSQIVEFTTHDFDGVEVVHAYDFGGDPLFATDMTSSELTDVANVTDSSGTIALLTDSQFQPSTLPDTTLVTAMPDSRETQLAWLEANSTLVWDPMDVGYLSGGVKVLDITAQALIDSGPLVVVLPSELRDSGGENVFDDKVFDAWIDQNTDDLYVQIKTLTGSLISYLRIEDYASHPAWPDADPDVEGVADFYELRFSALNMLHVVTTHSVMQNDSFELYPYASSHDLPIPQPSYVDEDDRYWALASFRDMTSITDGQAIFNATDKTLFGSNWVDGWMSEPGRTNFEGPENGPLLGSTLTDPSLYWSDWIDYSNAPGAIDVDFEAEEVVDDGWGSVDYFGNIAGSVPWLDGSVSADHFANLLRDSHFDAGSGDDWIHDFLETGAYIKTGTGADFVDQSYFDTPVAAFTDESYGSTTVILEIDGSWGAGFYAKNVGDHLGNVGTDQRVDIAGYLRVDDVVWGSADFENVNSPTIWLEINNSDDFTPGDKGVVMAADNVFGPRHSEVSGDDARFRDVHLSATNADDIIDMTSESLSTATGDGGYELNGMGGDDIIWGSSADESIYGGDGDDTLFAGAGSDWLSGGNGNDVFQFTTGSGDNQIDDYQSGDTLALYQRQDESISELADGDMSFDSQRDVTAFSWGAALIEINGQFSFDNLNFDYFVV